nr:hypothetical protein [Allobranchiibius sp. GilTou38]
MRAQALDPDFATTDVLRTALALGGEAKSEKLKSWARQELNGYGSPDNVPDYRRLAAAIALDGISGYSQIRGQAMSVWDLPKDARERVPERLPLTQPLEEIESLGRVEGGFTKMGHGSLEIARLYMNRSSDSLQHVDRIYFTVSSASIRALVGRVRTALVELVTELAAYDQDLATPTTEATDRAVTLFINQGVSNVSDNYTVNAENNQGVVGQGRHVQQVVDQSHHDGDVADALATLRQEIGQIADDDLRQDLTLSLEDTERALGEDGGERGRLVQERTGALRRLAERAAIPALTVAVKVLIANLS